MVLRSVLLKSQILRRCWARARARQVEARYQRWRDSYGRLAEQMGLTYDFKPAAATIRAHVPPRRIPANTVGNIHAAIMVLKSNWGLGMVQELEELGKVSAFDWTEAGYDISMAKDVRRLPEMNREFLQFLRSANGQQPLDWVFIPASGTQILRDTIRQIRQEFGVPVVNQWLDCKQNFEGGPGLYGQDTGQKDIASEFDLVWTSSRSTCEWYMAVGARPLFLSEGFSPRLTPRVECPKLYDVGFLGMCYGLRPDYVAALRNAGLNVAVRGSGWGDGTEEIPLAEMGRFFGQCKVVLGIGGVGYSMDLTTLKGRDFEAPGAGAAYLTTYNPDLAPFFRIGEEILCYRSASEMVELARRLVRDDQLRERLAAAAYARSMREHRWLHRFQTVLQILGILGQG